MNPRIVMGLAKQLQECQKKCPDGNCPNYVGVKVIIN